MGDDEINARTDAIVDAFAKDGFVVNKDSDVFAYNGKIGMVATHTSATIGSTAARKKVYYVEGAPHDMGYLMGMMAEPTISMMCTDFSKKALTDFINVQLPEELTKVLGTILDDIADLLAKPIYNAVPDQYKQELEGILDGCNKVNADTEVSRDALWVLNVGFDALLSFVYTFELPFKRSFIIDLKPEHFRIPLMCNGFSVFGTNPDKGPFHYMGRDFMFPTGGVFQDTATMIIYNPTDGLPFVSVSAPGIIGSMTAMNINGVGVGVDMAPAGNCNSSQPGLNSLLLNRHAIQNGKDLQEAIQVMADAQRGVSWIYILADGSDGKDSACVIEAGEKVDRIDFMSYPPEALRNGILQPVNKLLDQSLSSPDRGGLMVRMHDYRYPVDYLAFNEPLIEDFTGNCIQYGYLSPTNYSYAYNVADFAPNGFIDKSWKGHNCPMSHYFAPLRNNSGNLIVATNQFLIPEMRLCAMSPVSDFIAQSHWDDIQWRYDELSSRLRKALQKNQLSYEKAKETIDFLAADGEFGDYYNKDGKLLTEVPIQGTVSLLDLKKKTVESRYGYYSDAWIKLSIKNYIS